MIDILKFLSDRKIEFECFDHPPVYTVADVHRLTPDLPGVKTKNLFFRDSKNNRHFLVVVPGDDRLDMKALPGVLGCGRVRFGSSDRLKKYLGIEPGSVSLLAVINDPKHDVEVVIDKDLWNAEYFQFHPLVNTRTLILSRNGIIRFLAETGHEPIITSIPNQK
jgi:Ala-tRNA(Pro) deacylase